VSVLVAPGSPRASDPAAVSKKHFVSKSSAVGTEGTNPLKFISGISRKKVDPSKKFKTGFRFAFIMKH
jgi:hypothetical protein